MGYWAPIGNDPPANKIKSVDFYLIINITLELGLRKYVP
jgi:hypothetical protein